MKRFLEEARKLIRINSVSANGNEEISNYVATLMQDRGLKTHVQHVTHSHEAISQRQFNVIGILGDPLVDRKLKKGLLLNTHLDTVSPGILENWTETEKDPFSATLKDGKIFGLGTADVKLDFLCKLYAVEKFREKKLKHPIYLVGTCAEEIGMLGVKYLIKSLALNPKFVLVGEPSELKVVYAHKCLNLYRISIGYQLIARDVRAFNRQVDLYSTGKAAHSSYPHLGTNAILESFAFLQKASDEGFEMRFTQFSGGDTVNKVPDHARCQFFLTSHQFEDFKRFFRDTLKSEGKENHFRMELGGVVESGVRFLPDPLYPCLVEIVAMIQSLSRELMIQKDASYDPSFSTVNFGQMKQKLGGLDLHFDLRLLPEVSPKEIETRIKEQVQGITSKYPNLNVSVVLERMNPGLNMSLDDEWVGICRDAMNTVGIPPHFSKKATSTEAAQYFAAGYPAVVFGAGRSQGNSHSPNEHNILEQMEKSIAFYEEVIQRVCL